MVFQVYFLLIMFFLVNVRNRVLCADVKNTGIKVVDEETRYIVQHPNALYRAFARVNHAKGNIIFTSGKRIKGDQLIFTYMDETRFGRLTDIEVSLWYPAEGHDGLIISCVEFVTDLSTSDAEIFFVDGGGIGRTYAEILMTANHTYNFGYQVYLYGY